MNELWQPSASMEVLKKRAMLMRNLRLFFEQRDFLEVETPIIGRYGTTDVYLSNITTCVHGSTYYLQTSPEYHMKRLLAAGSGSIFQLARVFRDDEYGRWHNPEFTLLEWYHLGATLDQLMDELDVLLQSILSTPPMLRKTYQTVFMQYCDIDPFATSLDELQICLKNHALTGILPSEEKDIDQYLFLLMSHVVEPQLATLQIPVAVYHFPSSQASLANISNGLSERVEIYFRGVELANGFHELTDARTQAERFEKERALRQAHDLPATEPDVFLIDAMQKGLPACSGAAVGVDRLLSVWLQLTKLSAGIAFDFERA